MPAVDIGRVCLKTQGREKGNKCVIIDVIDRNFVVVTGPEVRRRRANMDHLMLLDE
ncbi:MAG TPA: 50S ribosomal protein L14e, partial [Candidatus Bathyarchaeota archaeon]|nr:50S ribosomal protein L14e [Candidatus Bathyarchaeota archaeon]